jgi:CRISPR-associated protein Csx10
MTDTPGKLSLPARFTIRLTMLSDWHVGSGSGRPGNIDRLVLRDADGLPYAPAKTLTGIWRDALERLAGSLDGDKPGAWSAWVDCLFGSQPALSRAPNPAAPVPALLSVRPAVLPTALRDHLRLLPRPEKTENNKAELERIEELNRPRRQLQAALTFVKPGVALDRRSGRARTDFLRFEEMVRVGTVLEAEAALVDLPEPSEREAAAALLLASTRLVERLGGKRRRGAGRCKLEIVGHEVDAALDWLERHPQPPALPAAAPGGGETALAATAAQDDWMTLPLALELRGPLAVYSRTVGNVVETLDFLPGTYLLPHVSRVLSRLGVDPLPAIARGDLLVLPATLEVGGARGRPVPLGLFRHKQGGDFKKPQTLVNRLIEKVPEDGPQLKQCRNGYVGDAKPGKLPLYREVRKLVRTHNTVEDDRQRPSSEVGGVYSYEVIAPTDQNDCPVRLRSELRLRKGLADLLNAKKDGWWNDLQGPCHLGRSKKDDYGNVSVVLPGVEGPRPLTGPGPALGDRLFVWLLSDVLLRGENLRPDPSAAALGRELQARLPGVTLTPEQSLVRLRRVESWHVGWCLARPSLLALQAGSCVVFRVEAQPDLARLREIEVSGLGERRGEGYGQVCFNDPLLCGSPQECQKADELSPPPAAPAPPITEGESVFEFACAIEEQAWRERIEREALGVANNRRQRRQAFGWETDGEQGRPPMSQLGGLRGLVQQLQTPADRSKVLGWLSHLRQNPRRADRWPGGNSADGALARVTQLFTQDSRVWDLLGCRDWPTLTAGAAERLKKQLWPLAVRAVVEACIRAHKRELEGQPAAREA